MESPPAWKPSPRRGPAALLWVVVAALHLLAWWQLQRPGRPPVPAAAARRLVVVAIAPPPQPAAAVATVEARTVRKARAAVSRPRVPQPITAPPATAVQPPPAASAPAATPVTEEEDAPLDLDDARRRAVRESARGPAGVVAARGRAPAAPEAPADTPLGREIAAAKRADCKDAYGGAGLFALPLLLRDAVTGRGCRWR